MILEWLFGARRRLDIDVASVCEQGLVRRDNQDHFFISPDRTLFCVADGMGGGDGGAKASEIVCAHMTKVAENAGSFPDMMKRASDEINEANAEIRDYAAHRRWRQMGSTLAAIFIDPSSGNLGVACHVGDSRIYRVRSGNLELLTHDHTVAGEIGRRASCKTLTDELAHRMGALSHVLTRAVGIEDTVTPDWRKIDIRRGDVYMICSDGVYDMLESSAICAALYGHDTSQGAVDALSKGILEAGAADNFTCIVIRIGGES